MTFLHLDSSHVDGALCADPLAGRRGRRRGSGPVADGGRGGSGVVVMLVELRDRIMVMEYGFG